MLSEANHPIGAVLGIALPPSRELHSAEGLKC